MLKLNEMLCVVTGGARGIGYAACKAFLAEGGSVILTDIDHERGRAAAAELGCTFQELDVRKEGDWACLARIAPHIDVLFNNAGVTGFEDSPGPHDPENASLADWQAVHSINTDGTFLGCRYAIGAMKAKGAGSIINMSSR
ncbi:SDR family NAD(P)-dependent oxidoreductase, partial [Altererythrobacter sp.]|nr:SDR family NAD(P)-dependent oxidoreductase [Altererythrobacter sp.]